MKNLWLFNIMLFRGGQDQDLVIKINIFNDEGSSGRPFPESYPLCAELRAQDSLRKSSISIRNPLPDLLQRGL